MAQDPSRSLGSFQRSGAIRRDRPARRTDGSDTADSEGHGRLFDDIWFARLPRMNLTTSSPYNLFTDPQDMEVTCDISGSFDRAPRMHFELVDLSTLSDQAEDWFARPTWWSPRRRERARTVRPAQRIGGKGGFSGSASWKPALTEPGYYRIRATIQGLTGSDLCSRDLVLAVFGPGRAAADSWRIRLVAAAEGDQALTSCRRLGAIACP